MKLKEVKIFFLWKWENFVNCNKFVYVAGLITIVVIKMWLFVNTIQ